jgi:hypothetical protein
VLVCRGTSNTSSPCGRASPSPPLPPPACPLDQLTLGCTCRAVSGLARHGGLGQAHRREVLDGDHLMVVDNTVGPHPGVVRDANNGVVYRSTSTSRKCGEVSPPGHRRSRRPTSQTDHHHVELGRLACLSRRGPRRPTALTRSWSTAGSTPIHSPGQNHQGQVGLAVPWRVLRLYGLCSRRRRPTHSSSPPSAAQHWRSSNTMPRTNTSDTPHPYLPMAEAMGLSGAFR